MDEGDPLKDREVIVEFVRLGGSVRVAAVDVASGEEVVIAGPVNAPQTDLERVALRKLARRLKQLSASRQPDPDAKTPRPPGRGVIV